MQALQLFGLLIMALFSVKQNKANKLEDDTMVTEAEMMSMEETIAIEEATEWIAEDMVIEEEAIASYETNIDPFGSEQGDYQEEEIADMISPPSVEIPDSTAMNMQAEWVTRVKEFGVLPTGPAAEFTFSFTNTGTEPITIAEAAPSCSCTVADYTKTPIQPGEKGWVNAVYETQGHPGFFKKFIRVEFADGSGTQLIVTGSVQ